MIREYKVGRLPVTETIAALKDATSCSTIKKVWTQLPLSSGLSQKYADLCPVKGKGDAAVLLHILKGNVEAHVDCLAKTCYIYSL